MQSTLAEKIERHSENVSFKRFLVKIPKLRVRKGGKQPRKKNPKSRPEISTSAIIRILLKAAAEGKKDGKEKKNDSPNSLQYNTPRDDRPILENAGYGTISRAYGGMIKTPYVDYGKLFSYLGDFRSKNAFEDIEGSPTQLANKVMERGNRFYFIDREVIDSGVRNLKYFIPGEIMGDIHAVPVGINSTDWEKFKLWQKIDPVMFNLKMNTI